LHIVDKRGLALLRGTGFMEEAHFGEEAALVDSKSNAAFEEPIAVVQDGRGQIAGVRIRADYPEIAEVFLRFLGFPNEQVPNRAALRCLSRLEFEDSASHHQAAFGFEPCGDLLNLIPSVHRGVGQEGGGHSPPKVEEEERDPLA
jgi:hypothetical protein